MANRSGDISSNSRHIGFARWVIAGLRAGFVWSLVSAPALAQPESAPTRAQLGDTSASAPKPAPPEASQAPSVSIHDLTGFAGSLSVGLAMETPLAWTVPLELNLEYVDVMSDDFLIVYGIFYREGLELPDLVDLDMEYVLDTPTTFRQVGLRVLFASVDYRDAEGLGYSGVQVALVGRWLDYESSVMCQSLLGSCHLPSSRKEAYEIRDVGAQIGPFYTAKHGAWIFNFEWFTLFYTPVSHGVVKAKVYSRTYADPVFITGKRKGDYDIDLRFFSASVGYGF